MSEVAAGPTHLVQKKCVKKKEAFSMFPSYTTPDSNDQLVIKLWSGLIRSYSCESGVVEEGNIENMQGSGSWGPELRNTDIFNQKRWVIQ